ncbi:MAG: HIT domain-containing protein [Myxococcota bacterium]|nr:HIT domain-containing protein [Myxococcota bacterium]
MSDESESGRLWAPWRIDYILGAKANDCPFCTGWDAGPGVEHLVLTKQRHSMVIMNRYPYTGGHLMVVPQEHVNSITDLSEEAYIELMLLLRESTARLVHALGCHGVNTGINQGEAAGAGIESHVHIHLVPRWRGDTNFMPVTASVRVVSQGLDHAFGMLRPYFEDLDAG